MPKLGFIHSIVFAESIEKTNSTLGTGSSGSKGNELVSELGVEEGRKSGSDAGSGVGITSPLYGSGMDLLQRTKPGRHSGHGH